MPLHRYKPDERPQDKSSGGLSAYVEAEKLMQIAFVLPMSVLICWGAGLWADHLFKQKWIMIAGIVFGCISGLTYTVRMAMDAEKKDRPGTAVRKGTGKDKPEIPS